MRYSEELIEEIRARNDIVDVIGEHVKLRRSGSRYMGLCPFHSEKTGSFSVSPDRQLYYCFGCHAAGNVITFEMQYQNASFLEAVEMLADRAGIALPKEENTKEAKQKEDRKEQLLSIYRQAAAFYIYKLKTKDGAAGLSYLRGRGLSDETIKNFGLGYAGKYGGELYRYLRSKNFNDRLLADSGLFSYNEKNGFSDRFWNRVMFPICDTRGRVIGFGGRVMGEGKPKYLNSPESELFNKRWNLFGLQIARTASREYVILCEGYMDTITMHQAGIKNAVASLGTALTQEQARLLGRYTKEVYLMYDSDSAGVAAAVRAVPILMEANLGTKVVNLAPYKDPDEFIKAEGKDMLLTRIKEARNGFLFMIDQLAKNYNLRDPQEKTRFEREAAERLLTFSDELERNNYTDAVCRAYHTQPEAMKRHIAHIAAQGTAAEHYMKPRSGSSKKAEDGTVVTQKRMLSYLAGYPDAFEASKTFIGPEDFYDPFCRRIADLIYGQLQKGAVSEARLLNSFDELEEQKEAAAVLESRAEAADQASLDRAFTDTVIKLMKQSSAMHMDAWNGDMDELSRLMEKKAWIERYEGSGQMLHINWAGEGRDGNA